LKKKLKLEKIRLKALLDLSSSKQKRSYFPFFRRFSLPEIVKTFCFFSAIAFLISQFFEKYYPAAKIWKIQSRSSDENQLLSSSERVTLPKIKRAT